jgi:hypothetical protein
MNHRNHSSRRPLIWGQQRSRDWRGQTPMVPRTRAGSARRRRCPMRERPGLLYASCVTGDQPRSVSINLERAPRLRELLTSGSIVFVTERSPVHTLWRDANACLRAARPTLMLVSQPCVGSCVGTCPSTSWATQKHDPEGCIVTRRRDRRGSAQNEARIRAQLQLLVAGVGHLAPAERATQRLRESSAESR